MASKREPSPSMRMRKIALVICEGETEERYINLLKKQYRYRNCKGKESYRTTKPIYRHLQVN